ncbi:hypothetical protein L218DRAFT_833713, partial [Marasmius fiardii PR-910]
PVEIHERIISDLTVTDTLNYELVDKTAYKTVKSFYRAALQVERVLSPYFNPEDIRRFRMLQHSTGLIVFGSTALSFFTRYVFEKSDLNPCIDANFILRIAYFVHSCGYMYRP